MSARGGWGFVLIAIAAFSCTKLKHNRCDQGSDCPSKQCDPSTLECVPFDGGTDGTGGLGGVGGAAGSKGTGGTPFTCATANCGGKTPICDVDAGSCRGCNAEKTTACVSLDGGTPLCVPGDAGQMAGMCVSCLSNTDCKTPQAPICNLSTGMCVACADSNACATKDPTNPVCVTTATATLMKGTCVGCLMDTQCTTAQTPICSLDTGTCKGCDAAGATACATKDSKKPVCVKDSTGSVAKGTCVSCLMNSDCNNTLSTTPICKSNACVGCSADSDCNGVGSGICIQDGHCATIAETIYVKNDTASCTDAPSVSVNAGTSAQPFCSMQPVTMYLSQARDLVIVSGAVNGATWSYNDNVTGRTLSIVGQAGALIASATTPAFSMQKGTVAIRAVTFSSSASLGISATGGTLLLQGATVDSCKAGGIALSNAAFDIENTTITNNGPGNLANVGGVSVTTPGTPSLFNLVTIKGNSPVGMSCGSPVQGTGVYATGNGSVQVADGCGITLCSSPGPTCGAQP